jgi:NADPH-dependent ferric siderophore reductase
MAPPSEHATRLAERLEGVVAIELEVADAAEVAPGLRALTLVGDLGAFEPWPGQDLMVSVPPGDAAPRWRRYTVRRIDRAAGRLDLWVTTGTGGPGATWALDATTGDRVDAVGPRGKIALRDGATDHVFVVDDAGLAACCAMAEALATPATVWPIVLRELDARWMPDATVLPAVAAGVALRPHFLGLEDVAWSTTVIDTTVAALDATTTAAYVFGELGLVRRATATLAEHLDPAQIAAKPYWRDGRANEDHGEPDRGEPAG